MDRCASRGFVRSKPDDRSAPVVFGNCDPDINQSFEVLWDSARMDDHIRLSSPSASESL
jgi:hypothetical protein